MLAAAAVLLSGALTPVAGARGLPTVRASGPVYVAAQPPLQALSRDGWTNRYLLDGSWLYRADLSDVGIAQGWWRNVAAPAGWSPATVPSAYNAGDFSPTSMHGYVGWYRKDFVLPPGPRGGTWIVRFESVNFRAEVWLNGHPLGGHVGTNLPFELTLRHLRAGANRLIVRVDNRRLPTDVPSGLTFGSWNYGGIVRDVYIRPVERVDLATVVIRPLLPCSICAASIQEQVLLRNVTGAPQSVRVRGSYGKLPVDFGTVTVAPYSTSTVQATIGVPRPRLWSIYQPTLYRATVGVYGFGGRQLGRYVTYSGIRSITLTQGGQLLLNGRVLHLRGAFIQESDVVQGTALDPAHLRRLVGWMRTLGGHLIRSHDPLNPQILELADQYGLLVWSEIPVTHELSSLIAQPAVSARAQQVLHDNILANENHPSILLWSIANELAAPTTGPEAAYIASAAALARSLDPTRPVGMAISDWPGLACQTAYSPVDVLGFNDYFGWFDAGAGATDDRDGLSSFLDSFRGCYPRKGLFVTEFGFDGNRNGPVEERGTYQFQDNSAAYHLGVFAQKPWLAGAVYFTLQEYASSLSYAGGNPFPNPPFNQKGLVDLAGNFKPAFATVAAIYRSTAQLGPRVHGFYRHPARRARRPARSRSSPARPAASRSRTTIAPGTVSVRISDQPVSRPLPAGFVGLSLEYGYVTAYAGTNAGAINPVLVRLIRNLAPGQQPSLRIGGDSTDWTWWPIHGSPDPAGATYNLSPRWIAIVRRLAQAAGARLVLGINLESGNRKVSLAEAHALVSGLGRARIEALELGNEPEAYPFHLYTEENGQPVRGRPYGYDVRGYGREFSYLQRLLGRIPLAGPATGSTSWLSTLSHFIATEPTLHEVTFHHYPLSQCVSDPASPAYPSVTHLLSGVAGRAVLGSLAHYAAVAHRAGLQFRVDELNAVTCQGKAGVSDTFGSALWILDTLFQMARSGVDAVNIHSWPGAVPNELFAFRQAHGRWIGAVRPIYYGALMFTRAAPPASRLLGTTVGGDRHVHVWAVRWADGSTRVVAINDSLSQSYRVAVRSAEQSGPAGLERLSAPSAYAMGAVTIAGQHYGYPTATGNLLGRLIAATVTPAAGTYSFTVPAAGAAALRLGS